MSGDYNKNWHGSSSNMRLEKYILSESDRTTRVKKEDVRDIIKSKCKNAIKSYKKGGIMYRGTESHLRQYQILDPAKSPNRTSAYTIGNYYTLIINNHKNWKSYPKREVIGTSSYFDAVARGNVYVVLPFDGFKLGVCPEHDIWVSFNNTFKNGQLNDFNWKLEDKIVTEYGYDSPDTFMEFSLLSNNIAFGDYKSLYDYATYVIDPKANGFKSYKNTIPKVKAKEMWTDSKCLLIYQGSDGKDEVLEEQI
jgi:hypothetical protein